jgi:hypothetical protein
MLSQDGSSQKKMRESLLFHSTDLIEHRIWIRKYKRMVDVKLRVVSEAELCSETTTSPQTGEQVAP